jgi:DNA (cytosine-5)-methyltransferase 1
LIGIDLFSGCGGLSLGLERSGIDIAAAYDNWQPSIDVYNQNFDHQCHNVDLSDVEEICRVLDRHSPDIIVGGPPCQDFSHAGLRKEQDRADLTVVFAQIISRLRPRFFLMENVDRALNAFAYKKAREIFAESGYGLTERILDSSYTGVPQRRKRLFLVGSLGDTDGFLEPYIDAALSDEAMTPRAYLGDEFGIDHYYRHPRNYNRRGIFSVDEPAPTVRGVNRPVPAGYKGHPGDPVALSGIRPLTTSERARLQTFPPGFKLTGTKTNLEQMIGNAVPVEMAKFIGSCISQHAKQTAEVGSS